MASINEKLWPTWNQWYPLKRDRLVLVIEKSLKTWVRVKNTQEEIRYWKAEKEKEVWWHSERGGTLEVSREKNGWIQRLSYLFWSNDWAS